MCYLCAVGYIAVRRNEATYHRSLLRAAPLFPVEHLDRQRRWSVVEVGRNEAANDSALWCYIETQNYCDA